MVNPLLWTVVITFGTLGNLNGTCLPVATEERLGGRVDDIHSTDIDKVIVESYHQRVGDGTPDTLLVTAHIIFLATDIHDDTIGCRRIHTEISTALFVDFGELVTWHRCLCRDSIIRYRKGRAHMVAHQFQHFLTITATQFTITGSVEMEFVGTVGAASGRNHLSSMEGLG